MAKKQTASGGRSTSSTDSKRTSKKRASTSKQKTAATTSRSSKSARSSKAASKSKPQKRVTKKRPEITRQPDTFRLVMDRLGKLSKSLRDPVFWRGLVAKLPPWTDEVGALLLIVLGVVMLTALLNTSSQGTFAVTVSEVLHQLFGDGAYIFSLGVLATGVIVLLPKFGIVLELGWARIAAIETAFGSLLALLHLFANDPQPRALAQEGGGGGFVGWALTEIISSLGRELSILAFGALFIFGIGLVFKLRLYHVTTAFEWLRSALQRSISRLDALEDESDNYYDDEWDDADDYRTETVYDNAAYRSPRRQSPAPRKKQNPAPYPQPVTDLPRRPSIVTRNTDPKPGAAPQQTNIHGKTNPNTAPARPNEPAAPARRQETQTDSASPSKPAAQKSQAAPHPKQAQNDHTNASQPDAETALSEPSTLPDKNGETTNGTPARPLTKEEMREIAERARRTMGAANGRSLVAPGEPGERSSVVPREFLPDARVVPAAPRARIRRQSTPASDRYFTVDDFRENKKIGKRDGDLPPFELLNEIELNKPTEEEINTNAKIIRNTLLEFDVEVEVIDVHVGPTVTQYAVSPYTEQLNEDGETVLKRVRVNEITNLGGDLALALSAKRLRIQAPVPGHSYVGIEVPNRQPSTVALRPVLESEQFYKHRKKPLVLPLGRDVSGEPFIADLATMPHLLIAGTTGSGKSIMLASMTTAFVMNNTPDQLRLVLLDPKMVELSRFNGLPHLLGPVETELDRIIGVLRWATREMDRRYKLLEKEAARNIETFNNSLGRRRKDEALPYIVIIIDEIGDLMMQRPDETERTITRLAQMARAVGIHLMIATQRPSVDVITGLIKANFPARISFAVASSVDSRVILDATGADTLMGRGDMLFLAPDASGPQRVQGCYVSDEEVNDVVDYWKQWHQEKIEAEELDERQVAPWERGMTRREVLSETDPMLEDAITLVVEEGEASASLIQRRLGLGYPRAARIIDMMHELGIVGASRPGGRTREVLVKPGTDPFKAIVDKRMKKNKRS